jgi:ribonuclease J
MLLTIHRGAKKIGGNCIELQSSASRILIDFGLPLVDENRERFDSDKIKNKSKEELIKSKILPDIKGLYKDEEVAFDAILLSHSHQDHYGLLSFVNPDIPIYLSQGCKELIEISQFFGQTDFQPINAQFVKSWLPFKIGDFEITPYLVDHSAFDALAFLIEAEGKRIFYSGDFRGHGRKSVLFKKMLERPLNDITCLILEGSMFGRDKGEFQSETDVENKLAELLQDKERLYFVACSSQNIDRIVSIYKACVRANRIFVIDPYTALILHKLEKISDKIPQSDWGKNIRIFFVPNSYTAKMAEDKSLFKFKSAKITYEQIHDMRNQLVVKDTYMTKQIFAEKKYLENATLIYSMWEGYLSGVESFWKDNEVPILKIHCSGHAYVEELRKFVQAIKPRYIVPIHTFLPEKYSEYLGSNIKLVNDGEEVDIL